MPSSGGTTIVPLSFETDRFKAKLRTNDGREKCAPAVTVDGSNDGVGEVGAVIFADDSLIVGTADSLGVGADQGFYIALIC